ncbi:unnamed protein product [Polarella glacialis]|uniref:Uncharacterized protein n=1 Tax=Polarella glacialis TaxID=89957 RepID=A0A813LGZ6_POLGL|nr:unnamed protein product [Polarella glacialis]CAE8727720.1 unnamed protein product [Polarella glacialis]
MTRRYHVCIFTRRSGAIFALLCRSAWGQSTHQSHFCPPISRQSIACAFSWSTELEQETEALHELFNLLDYHRHLLHSNERYCDWNLNPEACGSNLKQIASLSELACGAMVFHCFSTADWVEFVAFHCLGASCALVVSNTLKAVHTLPPARQMKMLWAALYRHTINCDEDSKLAQVGMDPQQRDFVIQDPLHSHFCPRPGLLRPREGLLRMASNGWLVDQPSVESFLKDLRLEESQAPSFEVMNLGAGDGECDEGGWVYDPANCLLAQFPGSIRGVWVEGDPVQGAKLAAKFTEQHPAAQAVIQLVHPRNAKDLRDFLSSGFARDHAEPDLLKVDLDNCDCQMVEALLQEGVLPWLVFVEIDPFWPPPLRLHCSWSDADDESDSDSYSGCTLQDYIETLGERYRLVFVEFNNALFMRKDIDTSGVRGGHIVQSSLVDTLTWSAWEHWMHGFWCQPPSRYFGLPFDLSYNQSQKLKEGERYQSAARRFLISRLAGSAEMDAVAEVLDASRPLRIHLAPALASDAGLTPPSFLDCRGDEAWAPFLQADFHEVSAPVSDFILEVFKMVVSAVTTRMEFGPAAMDEVFFNVRAPWGSADAAIVNANVVDAYLSYHDYLLGGEYKPLTSIPGNAMCFPGLLAAVAWSCKSKPCNKDPALRHLGVLKLWADDIWLEDSSWNLRGNFSLHLKQFLDGSSGNDEVLLRMQPLPFRFWRLPGDLPIPRADIPLPRSRLEILIIGSHVGRSAEAASAFGVLSTLDEPVQVQFSGLMYDPGRLLLQDAAADPCVGLVDFFRFVSFQRAESDWEARGRHQLLEVLRGCTRSLRQDLIVNLAGLMVSNVLRLVLSDTPMLHSFDFNPMLGSDDQSIDWMRGAGAPLDFFTTTSPVVSGQIQYLADIFVPSLTPVANHLADFRKTEVPDGSVRLLFWRADVFWWTHMGYMFYLLAQNWISENQLGWTVDHLSLENDKLGNFIEYADTTTNYDAVVLVPEDFVKTAFWELYSLNMPLFLPSLDCLARFFRVLGNKIHFLDRYNASSITPRGHPQLVEPFGVDGDLWLKVRTWGPLTDYYNLPHVRHFSSPGDLVSSVHTADLSAVVAGMKKEAERLQAESKRFHAGLLSLLS